FLSKGLEIHGYDKTPTSITDELIKEGINIHFEDDISKIPSKILTSDHSETLIIYTPAIPSDHAEFNYLKQQGYPVMKRSEVRGQITKNKFTIAVEGTHGKTTTSSMIAHLLKSSGIECTAFLGGITKNYNTNLLLGKNSEGKDIVVVEADEFDRSFLT